MSKKRKRRKKDRTFFELSKREKDRGLFRCTRCGKTDWAEIEDKKTNFECACGKYSITLYE